MKKVRTSFRCTNVTGGKNTSQIDLLNNIGMNFSATKYLSGEEKFWEIPKLETYLVTFNVILKYPRVSGKLLPTFDPSSILKIMVEMTSARLWKNMSRRKDFWLNLEEWYYQSFSWGMERSLHRCCSFIWTWGWFAEKQYRFVQYSRINYFNNFVLSAMNASREGDEKSNSSVAAETTKLLADSS